MRSVFHPSDRAGILDRLDRLRPDAKPVWGRMSAHGMVCHLTDSFQMVLGNRTTRRTGTLAERTVLRLLALSSPIPWPKGVETVPEVDQEQGGTRPEYFDADVVRLRTAMSEFVDRLPGGPLKHPMFGRLSKGEWGRWGYRHMDHHLRQFGL